MKIITNLKKSSPTEIRTRVAGFKVQSDSHYTIGLVIKSETYKLVFVSIFFVQESTGDMFNAISTIKLNYDCNIEETSNCFITFFFNYRFQI